jgi:hypothetical protein
LPDDGLPRQGAVYLAGRGGHAGETFNHRPGRLGRDGAHMPHGLVARLGDTRLGVGESLGEPSGFLGALLRGDGLGFRLRVGGQPLRPSCISAAAALAWASASSFRRRALAMSPAILSSRSPIVLPIRGTKMRENKT